MTPNQRKSLHALLDSMAETGEEFIAGGREHVATLFGLELQGDKWCVVKVALVPMVNNEAKDAIAAAMQEIVAPWDGYVFLTEAWVVMLEKGEEHPGIALASDPRRQEMFMLHFVAKLGEQVYRAYRIIRPESEAPARLGKKEETEVPLEGRFANFYDGADVAVPRGSA